MTDRSDACPLPDPSNDDRVRELLSAPRVVAVVGMSPNKDRPSNEVGLYLRDRGFAILPVHPKGGEVEGMKVYTELEEIPPDVKVEIVDLFIAGHRTLPVVEAAARIGARVVWFQPGAESPEAEARARELGLDVISGRCTKAEHGRLVGS